MATLLILPINCWIPDGNVEVDAGDVSATMEYAVGRYFYAFDTTEEEAILTSSLIMPSAYTGSGLFAKIQFFMATATSSNVVWDVSVEAVTPDTDTLDLEASKSWDSVNSGTAAVPGTAGDLSDVSITLTNADSIAVGDYFRLHIRRDCDHASDAAAGDACLICVEIGDDG